MAKIQNPEIGTRRFGQINWLGLQTLAQREIRRFIGVWTQTLLAPMVTAGLFLAIFSLAIGPSRGAVGGVSFVAFLAPGILMMTVIQNAFANTSSSIMIAKVQGNIVDTLMPPLSALETLLGYLAGSIVRGILVALSIGFLIWATIGLLPQHPVWVLVFVIIGGAFLGGLGIVAAIFAQKFDQMAAITNFLITPLSFLSGTFYSIENLPVAVQIITRFNPVFYLIDGVRYGFIGNSDAPPVFGLFLCLIVTAAVLFLCWSWLRSGYRLKP